jgi:transcriptional regulator with XRE-family HTH domain
MTTYQQALAAFLAREENAETALAERVGKSQAAINRYRNGKRFPDADTARIIDRETQGEVSFSIWQADFLSRSGLSAPSQSAA